jgi:hypothetical protein
MKITTLFPQTEIANRLGNNENNDRSLKIENDNMKSS